MNPEPRGRDFDRIELIWLRTLETLVGKASDELRSKVRQKFKDRLKKRSSGPGRGNRAQRPSCDPVPTGARARFRGLKDSRLAHNYVFWPNPVPLRALLAGA